MRVWSSYRGLRGERQRRFAALHQAFGGAHRATKPRDRAGLGMRQLRSAMVHHVITRPRGWHADRRDSDRGRAFGRRWRRRALQLSCRAAIAEPPRRSIHRTGSARRIPRQDSRGASSAGGSRRRRILGDAMYKKFPFAGEAGPVTTDLTELILNRTWRPSLSIIGADGIPALADAGNVLRPMTALRLSLASSADLRPESRARKSSRI